MRTFYLFKINDEYSKLTKNIPYNLYNTYLNMKLSNKDNYKYIEKQYKNITSDLKKEELNKLISDILIYSDSYTIYRNIHQYNNYFSKEVSRLIIYNTFMILETNIIESIFLNILKNIPNLFIIDFINKDYFWLKEFITCPKVRY